MQIRNHKKEKFGENKRILLFKRMLRVLDNKYISFAEKNIAAEENPWETKMIIEEIIDIDELDIKEIIANAMWVTDE